MYNNFFDEFAKVLNEMTQDTKEATKNVKNYILMNVVENEDEYQVEAAIPGVKKENINMNYHEGVLTIEIKKEENTNDDIKYLVRERTNNFYKRSIELAGVEVEGIRAKYENGILNVDLPKIKKVNKAISIE